jgi:hypothetical protein
MKALNVLYQSNRTLDIVSRIPFTPFVENCRIRGELPRSALVNPSPGDALKEPGREKIRQKFENGTKG